MLIYIYIYIYIYIIYASMCVCGWVCVLCGCWAHVDESEKAHVVPKRETAFYRH
jgi:hypothetical protein